MPGYLLLLCRMVGVLVIVVGCSRSTPSVDRSVTTTRDAAQPRPLEPSLLPVCGADADTEPLAMLCSIGEDASLAHFECGYPELLTVCNDIDTWGCRYFSLFGESPPRSRYEYAIRIGHTGPPIKPNEPFKTKARMAQSPRRGPIRGVAIQIHTTEEDDVQFTLARVNAAIRSWGCVDQGKRDEVEHFDCGSWAIDTHAFDLDLNKTVYVEAGLPGAFSCSQ